MSGPVDWPTLIAMAMVFALGWTSGFWFSSRISSQSAESEQRLQAQVLDLQRQIAAALLAKGEER